jgi:thymidylate kinase
VARLCRTLSAEEVAYCHWKSTESLELAAAGDTDLDLLVARRDAGKFEDVLLRFGFKTAQVAPNKQLPGVFNSYGFDQASGRLIHVHAHYQLIVGDDMTKNYRLPIEEPYLASSVQGPLFRVPTPEFELAVFVVRMILKHATWDAILSFRGSPSASERREFQQLSARADPARVRAVVREHLPFLSDVLWERCTRAIRPGARFGLRVSTAVRLERALAAHARRPYATDVVLKLWRRVQAASRRLRGRRAPRKRLDRGGVLIALVGGDGAGKSTAVEGLSAWLARDFDVVKLHLGKPSRSIVAALAQRAWALGRPLRRSSVSGAAALAASSRTGSLGVRGWARLVREVIRARDRWREYTRARRLAAGGAIVVCDRYPLPQLTLMEAPTAARMVHQARLARSVARLEKRYYSQILSPDVLIVLRVDPEVAVRRKLEEEGEAFVRPRSEEIWRLDWSGTPATVVDAGRSKDEVLAEIKSVVWSRI